MRLFLATLLAFAVSPLLSSPAAAALVTYNPYYGSTTWRPSSIVWGDSLTRLAYHGYRAAGFTGEINGRSGRSVEALLTLVRERIRATSPTRTAVIALGSNGGSGTFQRWEYVEAIRLLKADGARRVVLVTPYRDGTWWDTEKVAERARWMREIARADRSGVCVADWAARAAEHPEFLTDGLHYNAVGKQAYVGVIMARVRWSCV